MSLRRRLVLGMAGLLVAGVVTTDLVAYDTVRVSLVGQLDAQLDGAQDRVYGYVTATYLRALAAKDPLAEHDASAWLAELGHPTRPPLAGAIGGAPLEPSGSRGPVLVGRILASHLDPDVYLVVLDASGRVVFRRPSGLPGAPDPPPVLPRHLPVQALPPAPRAGGAHRPYAPERPAFDVGAVGEKGAYYRAEAVALPGGVSVTLVGLGAADATLRGLERIEVLVSIGVVLGLVVLTLWVVGVGLRPLRAMAETAGAIAAGDLSRRVGRVEERGEVGRLARAIDAMLAQIERAFAARTRSEERLRRFVADASHELRTPLTTIRGYAELLKRGVLEEAERARAVERIVAEARRMGTLVDELLTLARLDQGRQLEWRRVALMELAQEAVEAAQVADPDRPIALVAEPAGSAFELEGDPRLLRQVLDNLVGNALEHTPPRTPVTVVLTEDPEHVLVAVRDEGPGLAFEHAARVFDRFYRAHAPRHGGGAGLGLSIVAAVAEAHGGHARVESEPGRGATFVVVLPRRRSPGSPDHGGSDAGADDAAGASAHQQVEAQATIESRVAASFAAVSSSSSSGSEPATIPAPARSSSRSSASTPQRSAIASSPSPEQSAHPVTPA
jgi:two-component system OmpR family sensor kinase